LFAEMDRVLKKGGRTVHVSEADSVNPMFKFARRHPDLFQKHFIDKPGHVGLERPSELKSRFEKHGFKPVTFKRLSSNLQEPGTLAAFFDNEYKAKSWKIKLLVGIDKVLAGNLAVKQLLSFILEPLAQLDDFLSPLDHSAGVLVVFEK